MYRQWSRHSNNNQKNIIMENRIEKVAVLGAGTMGAQIAGHFSNAGIPALLLSLIHI